jgi:hypothetical protein
MDLVVRTARIAAWLGIFVWLVPAGKHSLQAEGPIQLRDTSRESGVAFRHTHGGSGERYIMETVSAGLALFDYDQDGDLDLYFLNGAPLGQAVIEPRPRNALYRNEGRFRFTDVTEQAGVGDPGYGLAVAVADYNQDGFPDIYVNNFGDNVLYQNRGDGTFVNAAATAGIVDREGAVAGGTCFLDADRDGNLDLYVSRYLNFSYDTHPRNTWLGHPVYPGPNDYLPTPDALYRSNGEGTFTDVSAESGIAAHAGRGMGMVCADYDNDGDTDIFMGNDNMIDFLFQNDGTGKFEEVGLLAGVACDLYGSCQGTMGIDCGDYDNDGLLDFYQTSYQNELATLYQNQGDGLFDDVSQVTSAAEGTFPHVTWGVGMVDFDNDGHRDIFIACGHLYDNVEEFSDVTRYKVQNLLLKNSGDGTFSNVSRASGDGLLPRLSSRGAAFGDLDNDGRVDAVILNSEDPSTLLRNESRNSNHWLRIRLIGRQTNRDAVGSQVRVTAGGQTWLDEVHSGRSYQSHFGTELHFGLGTAQRVDRVEVRWLGGDTEVFAAPALDCMLTLCQGEGNVE